MESIGSALTAADVDRQVESAIAALRKMPYAEYLRTAHWQRMRAFALEESGNACELCGHDDRLEVHHRTYARIGFEQPGDLMALCSDCHRDHHKALVLRAIRASEAAPARVSVGEAFQRVKATA